MGPAIPVADKSSRKDLVGTSASLTACAASKAWTSSGITGLPDLAAGAKVPLQHRALTLWVQASAGASATTGQVGIRVLLCAEPALPASAVTAVWFNASVTDGSVTATADAGALPASTVFTATPSPGFVTIYPAVFAIGAAAMAGGTSDIILIKLPRIDVTDAFWFQVLFAETGDSTHPSSVWISYSLST